MQRLNNILPLKGLCLTAGVILGLTLLPSNALAQQIVLTEWNFNSVPPDSTSTPATGTTIPNIGSGTASLVGGTTATFAAGGNGSTSPNNSSDPATSDDSGWNTAGYPGQGSSDKTAGVRFKVSTLGYQDITVKWDQRFSNTASRNAQFQYSIDGINFVDSGLLSVPNSSGDDWFNGNLRNLSSIPEVNNNANFAFQIVSAFEPSTSSYFSADAGTSQAYAGGTWRFDMVQVNATPVPEPFTIIGSLTAIGIGTVIKRKYVSAGQVK
ncbi:hypothetical protein CAL7716_012350 [Calothrix sp. PCC 7716]|nr:hypothetical protein CAL7716_012350 [Calothrix sp. PCC 7716]